MHRHLIFSDVHGNAHRLQHALYLAGYNPETDTLFSLGDVIDRGRHTRNCMDLLLQLPQKHKTEWIAGNHEALLIEALGGNATCLGSWLTGGFGAQSTIMSYGVDPDRIGTYSGNVQFDRQPVRTAEDVRAVLLAIFGERHLQAIESSIYALRLKNVWDGIDFFLCHAGGIVGRWMDEIEDWLLAWGSDEYDRGPGTHRDPYLVTVYGHFHHRRVTFGRKKIRLAVQGEVAILVVGEERGPLIVVSDGEEIQVEREYLGI